MFSDLDRKLIFQLATELTGAGQTGQARQEALALNLQRRIDELGLHSLVEYLRYVDANPNEHAHLVSALTIHTTSWFRENPHFVRFQEILLTALQRSEVFKVWCAGCSTGEEVYSFALVLEEFRRVNPQFDYRLLGTDVDPLSIQKAQRAVYPIKQMNFHLGRYRQHLMEGSGRSEGFFTLSPEIRDRCQFRVHDLRQALPVSDGVFHLISCRNVLIYFDPQTTVQLVQTLVRSMAREGRLVLGHSEHIAAKDFGLNQEGHSVYAKIVVEKNSALEVPAIKYRVLSIDDSGLARKKISEVFTDLGFESITVASGTEATSYLNTRDVDAVTLDLNMPDSSGDKWLKSERAEGLKTPIVILSEAHPSEAPEVVKLLAMGAQEYIEKSQLTQNPKGVGELVLQLIQSSKRKGRQTRVGLKAQPTATPDLILIGASTGGPQALTYILKDLPKNAPPVLVTQHISAKFAKPLAERLCSSSGLSLGHPSDGTLLKPGHLYMSFGEHHLGVAERDGELVLAHSTAQTFNGHRPSVDVMFNSALGLKRNIMAILLTGMGRDGALGLRFLHKEGAFCIAQSEEDCMVYGMPREAIERGAVNFVGNLEEIHSLLLSSLPLRKSA